MHAALQRELNSSTEDILRFFALKPRDLFKLPFLNSQQENLKTINILANTQEFLIVVSITLLLNYFFLFFS